MTWSPHNYSDGTPRAGKICVHAAKRVFATQSVISGPATPELRCPRLPPTADIHRYDGDVRFVPIVLQKSFCVTEYKSSGPYAGGWNNHLRCYPAMNSLATSVLVL